MTNLNLQPNLDHLKHEDVVVEPTENARSIKPWPSPPPQELATVRPTIEGIISQAVQAGRTGTELKELLDVYERLQANKAEQAFNAAFAQFKKTCGPIVRHTTDGNPQMSRVNRDGVKGPRKYAALDDITAAVDKPLFAAGLSYDWAPPVMTDNGTLSRVFVLRHVGGHSRSTSSPPIPIEGTPAYKVLCSDRKDSSASPQQRYGIADTYAMRYSMLAGLGLATCDEDSDAAIEAAQAACPTITAEQFGELEELMTATATKLEPFCKFFQVKAVSELPASRFDEAVAMLNRKPKVKT